jgi:predicted molibdopterin-dependent oxidoreductase YjgC
VPLRGHPVSEGSLCIRGWNSCDYVFHSDRIDAPLIMRDGKQTKCTWDEALEKAAADLQKIMQRWGSESIAFIGSPRCSNEDNYLLMKLARQVVGTGSIDTSHRLTYFPILDALYDSCGVGASTASFDTLARADLILAVGADATSSAPQAASRIFHALNGKAELIVVDPRSTKLAKQATHHWKVRPGSDSYWINAMTCYLIEEKKVSADFLDRKTTGFAAMKKEMGQFSLSLAETKTGIPPDSLKLAANRLATAKRAVFIIGDGAGDGGEVKKTVYGLVNLAFVTGHGGGDGSGIIVVGGENNTQGAWDMGVLPDRLPGGMPIDKCNKDTLIRLNFDTQPVVGRDYGQIMRGILSGEIRGLYVMGENLLAFREQDRAFIDALAQLESLVVQEIFPNYLTAMAAVVFPASAPYEREGTYTNLERRVQRFESIVKPQRETKPDWEIICRVAKAMGAGFTYLSTNEINDEIAIRVPFYEGLNSQALGKMRDGIRWPEANDGGKGCPWLQANWKGTFYCSNFDELDKVETSEEFPLVLICGHLPSFWNTGTRSSRSALLSREENRAALQLNPDDARRFQVREGWRVNVIHSSGNMQTSVVFSEDLPTGVAFLPLHNVDGRPPLVGKRHIPVRVESC